MTDSEKGVEENDPSTLSQQLPGGDERLSGGGGVKPGKQFVQLLTVKRLTKKELTTIRNADEATHTGFRGGCAGVGKGGALQARRPQK